MIRRAEVRANRELLLELAERLGAGGPLCVEGLAITSLLVGDGLSPLFCKGNGSLTLSPAMRCSRWSEAIRRAAT